MTNATNSVIRIDNSKRTITITKAFNKLASIYGSDEYKMLRDAKLDNPTYRVIVKSPSKKKIEDRITMNDIIKYVVEKSGEESAEMDTLKELRGVSIKQAGSLLKVEETASFAKIKEWFFLTYPELGNKSKNRQNRINEILAEAAKRAEAANEAVSA